MQWPLIGWGAGVLAHAAIVFGAGPSFVRDWQLRKIKELKDKCEAGHHNRSPTAVILRPGPTGDSPCSRWQRREHFDAATTAFNSEAPHPRKLVVGPDLRRDDGTGWANAAPLPATCYPLPIAHCLRPLHLRAPLCSAAWAGRVAPEPAVTAEQ